MPGLVGVIANDFARASLFTSCVWKLDTPPGWQKEMLIGGDWCGARNTLCQMVLDEGYSHLFFMDDDHAFPPQMLNKLLAHDKPLVTPVCLTRTQPFTPVQYTEKLDGEYQYLPIPLSQSGTDGLVEIQAGGCAGMLIRRDVIESIPPPWFKYSTRSEDILFCEAAKDAGFELFADLSVRLGHITTAVVWPAVDGDHWVTGLTVGGMELKVETADKAAKPKPWIWELRQERDERVVLVRLQREPDEPVNWAPDLSSDLLATYPPDPTLVWQWFLDMQDGEGFKPVGDPFTYTLEQAK